MVSYLCHSDNSGFYYILLNNEEVQKAQIILKRLQTLSIVLYKKTELFYEVKRLFDQYGVVGFFVRYENLVDSTFTLGLDSLKKKRRDSFEKYSYYMHQRREAEPKNFEFSESDNFFILVTIEATFNELDYFFSHAISEIEILSEQFNELHKRFYHGNETKVRTTISIDGYKLFDEEELRELGIL